MCPLLVIPSLISFNVIQSVPYSVKVVNTSVVGHKDWKESVACWNKKEKLPQ